MVNESKPISHKTFTGFLLDNDNFANHNGITCLGGGEKSWNKFSLADISMRRVNMFQASYQF